MRDLFEQGWFRLLIVVGTISVAWGWAGAERATLKKSVAVLEEFRFSAAVELARIAAKVDENNRILKTLEKRGN